MPRYVWLILSDNFSVIEHARCYIEPVLIEGQSVGSASTAQMDIAAAAIMDKCIAKPNPESGIAFNIGDFFLVHAYPRHLPIEKSYGINGQSELEPNR